MESSRRGSSAAALRGFDFFKKLPGDLVEGTVVGGSMSIVTIIILVLLLANEVWSVMKVETKSWVEVDQVNEGAFIMNLNLSFPEVSCDFLSVSTFDAVGKAKKAVFGDTLYKYSKDGAFIGTAKSVSTGEQFQKLQPDPEVEHPKNVSEEFTIALTPRNFDRDIHDHDVVIVKYHAPWCIHCQHFWPVFEAAAKMVRDRVLDQLGDDAKKYVEEHGPSSYYDYKTVAFMSVDCTTQEDVALCKKHGITGFPTTRVYRKGMEKPGNPGAVHESYVGARVPDVLADWAMGIYEEVKLEKNLPMHDALQLRKDSGLMTVGPVDVTGSGDIDSFRASTGCMIEGYLKLAKVPGRVIISLESEGHDFAVEAVNMTHYVDHLSFGKRFWKVKRNILGQAVRGNLVSQYESFNKEGGTRAYGSPYALFRSSNDHVSHEHFLKIVQRRHDMMLTKVNEYAFDYTIQSGIHPTESRKIPEVTFAYDISPIAIVYKEVRKSFSRFIFNVIALMGGGFTCMALLEGGVLGAVKRAKKGREGKLG